MIEFLFWFLILLIFYVYFGYPSLLFVFSKLFPAPIIDKSEITPSVSIIIAAYNEENLIALKIENSLRLDYPKEKLEIIVASDGSTDGTNDIVRSFNTRGVHLVPLNSNMGKSVAQNMAVEKATGEILLFTDADTFLHSDALRRMNRNFADDTVGCVVGTISYPNEGETTVSRGEGTYWRYELFIRHTESEVGNFAMGSGIMAIRRDLFMPLNPDLGDDFVLPMLTALNGNRVIYESEANCDTILQHSNAHQMLRSRIRVITKDLRGLFYCNSILNPLQYPLYSLGLISHKFLRWLIPYFLIGAFIFNSFLLDNLLYGLIFIIQIIFYSSAFLGFTWQNMGTPPKIFSLPFFFCLVNFGALVAVASFLVGKRTGRWQPVRIY